jgi:hypothetical protein
VNKTYLRLKLVLLACSPIWLLAVGLGGTINHGDLGPGTRVSEADVPGCEPLPDDANLIPNLRTGWARMTNGQLHVLLSDAALHCPNPQNIAASLNSTPACGTEMWTLNYDLPEEMQAVGIYNLTEHAVNWDLIQQSADALEPGCTSSCATMTMGGTFIPGGEGPQAQLEVLSIDARCITGRIIGLDQSGQIVPPPPELNGAFRAVRCD